ncbi:MAG: alpha/beta fold hydrolase [Alphaproteobacteria bacterium]|nr:alpha/beta fold hydrolase [Alphaproteobacteria bacterium]
MRKEAEIIKNELDTITSEEDTKSFNAALGNEIGRRMDDFMKGVQKYRAHPYKRELKTPPAIWKKGAASLYQYGDNKDGHPIVVVPSLVNKAYILDITEDRSFMRYLANEGFNTHLLDWGTPSKNEKDFTTTDYVYGHLLPAIKEIRKQNKNKKVSLIGYCMGGALSLPLAENFPEDIATLILLASPWDFHAVENPIISNVKAMFPTIMATLEWFEELPVDIVQTMFTSLDPNLVIKKFERFSRMDVDTERARNFIALEDWLNDGIPLVANVAEECFKSWYIENATAKGKWKVNNKEVKPENIGIPTLSMIPKNDRIVPPISAKALADIIPNSDCMEINSGHIGMIASGKAPTITYAPLANWLMQKIS